MKHIVIIPSGMTDYPLESLGGKTPLESSHIPNMNYLAKTGKVGLVKLVPNNKVAASELAALSLLGYPVQNDLLGRASFEAASLGMKLEDNEIAFCCNFVTEFEGKMIDHSAGHISSDEAGVLIDYLNEKLGDDRVRFYKGSGYRHICVIRSDEGPQALDAICKPPHEVLGKTIESNLPKGMGADILRDIMLKAKHLIQSHEINVIRTDLGENPANLIWLWGQGVVPQLQMFHEKFGVSGALISGTEMMKGLATVVDLNVVHIRETTGMLETDYEQKVDEAIRHLKKHDLVIVHIQAPEEASYLGDITSKIKAIEGIDYHIIGAFRKYAESHDDVRILISPDLSLPVDLKTHTLDAVPFLISGKEIEADEIETYSEKAAKYSSLKFDQGHELIEHFVKVSW